MFCILWVCGLIFLWGRSTQAMDLLAYGSHRYEPGEVETMTVYALLSRAGSIGFSFYRQRAPIPAWRAGRRLNDAFSWQVGSRDNRSWPTARRFGFRIGRVDDLLIGGAPPPQYVAYAFLIPHWLPISLLSLLPLRLLWLIRRRMRRAERGLCLSCGYDLRGSQIQDNRDARCPECGGVVGGAIAGGTSATDRL